MPEKHRSTDPALGVDDGLAVDRNRIALPGRFVSLIVASSHGGTVSLGHVALDEDNLGELARTLWATKFESLSVEQKVQWSAIYMYASARSEVDPDTERALPSIAVDLRPWLLRARDLWKRYGVEVPEGALAAAVTRAIADRSREPHDDDQPEDDPSFSLYVERLLPVLGSNRLRIRVIPDDATEPSSRRVRFRLRVHGRRDVDLQIEDAPGGTFEGESVSVPIGEAGTEVLFRLYATEPLDDLPVEVYRSLSNGWNAVVAGFRAWQREPRSRSR